MTKIRSSHKSIAIDMDCQTPESWSEILAQFADASIYQTWAYGATRWGADNLSHLVIRRDGQIVGAAQLRIARLPLLPVGIAYLRWGPLCHRRGEALDSAIVAELMGSLRREYCKRRGLTLQVMPNAYPGDARGVAFAEAFSRNDLQPELDRPCYRTVLVDLTPSTEIMRKRLAQKWRNQLNSSEKNGLVLEISDSLEAYREFVTLYEAMWERKRFETSVDVEEFARIQGCLSGSEKMQIFLAKADGESIGGLACSLIGDTGIYLLGATNERARELKAAYFLQWHAMLWLKDHGARCYDLGGVDPVANPGGYHFKSGFGGDEATQVPSHAVSGGALGQLGFRGIAWLRRCRTSSHAPVRLAR